jgi:hypothetical protein
MIDRELTKFPESVSADLPIPKLRQFVLDVLCESARDMAESQTDYVDEDTLIWIVEAVLGDGFDPEITRILKNRIQALAFFGNDDRPARKRFAHSEFFNLFLSTSCMISTSKGEIPKYIRRGILGPDFLITFSLVIQSAPTERARAFVDSAKKLLDISGELDRAGKNLGALLVAALPVGSNIGLISLNNIDADDTVIRGVAGPGHLKYSIINQMDVRESDVSEILFEKTTIATLLADDTTRVGHSFPNPGWIQLSGIASERLLSGQDALVWLDRHGRDESPTIGGGLIDEETKQHPLYQLLQKVCRAMLRQHWIRSDGDDHVTKLIQSAYWPQLREILNQADLLEERHNKPASGPPSVFYHVRRAKETLAEDPGDVQTMTLLRLISSTVQTTAGSGG